MKKILFIFLFLFMSNAQARLRNCNNCNSCSNNQTCCFIVNCPEDCNSYTCNPHCPNVSNPKCIYDSTTGKYMCICN